MTMTEKLDLLMREKGLNKAELARESGIPYMTIVNFYVKGTENVKRSTLLRLASFFGVTVDFLAVDEETRRDHPKLPPLATDIIGSERSTTRPRLNTVVKGNPFDEANILCYDELPMNVRCDFTLAFEGDSMIRIGIQPGFLIYAVRREAVENHDLAVVKIDNRITLRRYYQNDNKVVLLAENPSYAPAIMTAYSNIRILGKAIAFIDPAVFHG